MRYYQIQQTDNQLFKRVLNSNTKETMFFLFLFFASPKKRTKRKEPFFKVFFEHCPKTRTALLNFLQGFKNSLRKAILTLVNKEGMISNKQHPFWLHTIGFKKSLFHFSLQPAEYFSNTCPYLRSRGSKMIYHHRKNKCFPSFGDQIA